MEEKSTVTRFITHEYRIPEYESMLQDISHVSKLSVTLLRQFSERALNKWEHHSKRDVLTLFIGRADDREKELSKSAYH